MGAVFCCMQLTSTAHAIWSGGRYVPFGRPLSEHRLQKLARAAYERGVRTFVTSDVYGEGAADRVLGEALSGFPRESFSLVTLIGHDIYQGQRDARGMFPRFTDPQLRGPNEYGAYLRHATEAALQRCRTDYFDAVLLHNPDRAGYESPAVWEGMAALRSRGLSQLTGLAPGPANGFALDIIHCMERFAPEIHWAMIILNPLEPWPMQAVLPAAVKHNVALMARVVDCGGLFHDDIVDDFDFGVRDHRRHRPRGWIEAGVALREQLRPIAETHGQTLLQFACAWALSQPAVKSVVPTLIQERGAHRKCIEEKLGELAAASGEVRFTPAELKAIQTIGNNRRHGDFSQDYKGASPAYNGPELADRWPMTPELEAVARRWGVDLAAEQFLQHAGQDSQSAFSAAR